MKAKRLASKNYLRYFWGECLQSKQHGKVRFLRWLDTAETLAEVAELGSIRPLPAPVSADDLSRTLLVEENILSKHDNRQFNTECDEARKLLKKS